MNATTGAWNKSLEASYEPSPMEVKLAEQNDQLLEINDRLVAHGNKMKKELQSLKQSVKALSGHDETLKKVTELFNGVLEKNGDKPLPVIAEIKNVLPKLDAMRQTLALLDKTSQGSTPENSTPETVLPPARLKEAVKLKPKTEKLDSIKLDEEIVLENLKALIGLEEALSKPLNENEAFILTNLAAYRSNFDNCIKAISAQHLTKVQAYREGLKQFIDYLKDHAVKESEYHSIAQFMFTLSQDQLEAFDHAIPFDIKEHLHFSMKEVERQELTNSEWIERFEKHHDAILKDLLDLQKVSQSIEWKLNFYKYREELFQETALLKKNISELSGHIGEISANLSNATKHREETLSTAKDKKNGAIGTFNRFAEKAKELSVRVENEKQLLSQKINELPDCKLKLMCDNLHFYDEKAEDANKKGCQTFLKDLNREMELHLEDLRVSLNLIAFDLSKKAPAPNGIKRDSVYFELKKLASSIETNAGKSRADTFYRAKEWLGSNNTHGIKALDEKISSLAE